MKKKIMAMCLIVALAATAVVGGTLAYFTDTENKENVFTVGGVDIKLTEPNWEGTGEDEAVTVYPGEPLAKDPTVTVVEGSNPCFVRLMVTNLDQFAKDGKGMIEYLTDYKVNELGEGWELYEDGFFYWTKPLVEKGAINNEWNSDYDLTNKTTPLFDQIKMPIGLEGGEEAAPIVVYAQAVQAQGAKASWAAVNGMSVADIAAWFTTCGMAEPDISAQ